MGRGENQFCENVEKMLCDNGVQCIYFDAFENDFYDDPFTVIVSVYYSFLKDKGLGSEKINNFKEQAIKVSKIFAKSGLKIVLKMLTAGVTDGTKAMEAIQAIGEEFSSLTDKYLFNEEVTSHKSKKDELKEFQESLEETINENFDGNLVFIIDELDRCRPDYTVELIEKIKHIFNVPNLKFLLVMNRKQLEEAIKWKYGQSIDASNYLQKFIHAWLLLPSNKSKYSSDKLKYFKTLTKKVGLHILLVHEGSIESIILYYDPSLRQLEHFVRYLSVIMHTGYWKDDYIGLICYLCLIKVLFPNVFQEIGIRKIKYEDLIEKTKEKFWIGLEGRKTFYNIWQAIASLRI